MTRSKLRTIKIDGNTYLWKREHLHLSEFEHAKCVERVVIYLDGYKKSPLQLLFREDDNLHITSDDSQGKWFVGYPNEGVIWSYKNKPSLPDNEQYSINQRQTIAINLNCPAVIAGLITYFLQTDWKPRESTRPHNIEDALRLLEVIELPKAIY